MSSKLKKIKVAIAGQGRSGFNIHARTLGEDLGAYFEIVAVADELPGRCDIAVKEYGAKAYKDYKAMIKAGGFDLFINALPQPWHIRGSVAAMKAGYHVVCEKPLSSKVKDLDTLVQAAKKYKRQFIPFQQNRFQPFFAKMQEVINSGVLGDIIHIRSNWTQFARRWDWQTFQENMGGTLLNTGPHAVDQAVLLLGGKKPKVFCRQACNNPFDGDADDFCALTLYGNDLPTIEILISSYCAYDMGPRYTVNGQYGSLSGNEFELKWKYFDPKKAPKQKMWSPWSKDRQYPREKLQWKEKVWNLDKAKMDRATGYTLVSLPSAPAAYYENVHDVLVNKAKQLVTIKQVRRQLEIMEAAIAQNKLPKKGKKHASITKGKKK